MMVTNELLGPGIQNLVRGFIKKIYINATYKMLFIGKLLHTLQQNETLRSSSKLNMQRVF